LKLPGGHAVSVLQIIAGSDFVFGIGLTKGNKNPSEVDYSKSRRRPRRHGVRAFAEISPWISGKLRED